MTRAVTVASTAAIGCLVGMMISSAPASADDLDVIGMKYWQARTAISQENMTPVVGTVLGDRLPQNDCVVVGLSTVTKRDSSGEATGRPEVKVNLNCYKQADGKAPGFAAGDSGMTAEAVRTKRAEADLEWKQSEAGRKYCENRYAEHPEWAPDADCETAYPYLAES